MARTGHHGRGSPGTARSVARTTYDERLRCAAVPKASLRVLTLNLWARDGDWPSRRTEAAAWLRFLDPDVVLLQEVVSFGDAASTAHEVVDEAGGGWHATVHQGWVPPPFGGEGVTGWGPAILTRVAPEVVTVIPLTGDDRSQPALHVRAGGVDATSCHLAAPPLQNLLRQRQVLDLDEAVRTLDGGGMLPPVMGGDLNADHDSDEVRFLVGLTSLKGRSASWRDAWRVAGPDEPGWTLTDQNPNARPLAAPRRRVDFVFAGETFRRPQGAGRILDCRLACHRSLTGAMASDHFGVVADLWWPQRPERWGTPEAAG